LSQLHVIVDASVLINFLRIDRMDLIGAHPGSFIVTDKVADEISYPDQKSRYKAALSSGYLVQQKIDDPLEVEQFLRLNLKYGQHLGAGELSAIAVALNRNCLLAIDDNRAVKDALRKIGFSNRPDRIIRTQDIVVELIKRGYLTLEEAESIKVDWETNHRFALKISSFRELLYGTSRAE